MSKKLIYISIGIFILFSLILIYFVYATSTIRIDTIRDNGNCLEGLGIDSLVVYNGSGNDFVFIGSRNGRFCKFDADLNQTIKLTGSGGVEANIFAMESDYINARVYWGGDDGINNNDLRYFSIISNSSSSLNDKDAGDWLTTSGGSILSISYDFNMNRTYFLISSRFGYYDGNLDALIDLSGNDDGNWFATGSLKSLYYANGINRTYIGGGRIGGAGPVLFGWFDIALNKSINASGSDIGDWLDRPFGDSTVEIKSITRDNKRNITYIGGSLGKFGYFNETSNQTINLNGTDVNNWIKESVINSLSWDGKTDLVYMSLSGGRYGYYDINKNQTIDLTSQDDGDWIGGDSLSSIVFDVDNNRTYLTGGGKFGYYGNDVLTSEDQPPKIINNYTYPQLTPTLNNAFNITAEINGTNAGNPIIYANFSIRASNGTTLLNNINGTHTRNGQTYNFSSTSFIADDGGTWRWNYTTRTQNSSTEVFRSGQFTISDTTSPIVNITFPFNNSIVVPTNVTINWTVSDNIRPFAVWYIKDDNYTVNTSVSLFNNFSIDFSIGNHNITMWANDTTGNENVIRRNFTTTTDNSFPDISITIPATGSTQTSQTITTAHSITDNVAISLSRYSVYSGGTLNIENRTITNPSTNTTLIYTTTLGCSSTSYTLYMWANDTAGNERQVTSTYTCTASSSSGGTSGGGGQTITITGPKAIGESCTDDSDCSSNLCDLEEESTNYGTCQNSLCGNGIASAGESFFTCPQDFQTGGGEAAGFFIKSIPYLIGASFLLLFLYNQKGDLKKWWKSFKEWF